MKCIARALVPVASLAALLVAVAGYAADVSFDNAKLSLVDTAETRRVSGLLAKPEGDGPFPAVVILHSCGGMMSHVSHDWPTYLKGLGYVVLSVDTFGSRGLGPCPNALNRGGSSLDQYASFEEMTRDAYGALDYLAARPFVDNRRIAVIGFSLGGFAINRALILENPRETGGPDFKAAISVYAGCWGLWKYTQDMIPLMQIAGERDTRLADSCREVARLRVPIDFHVLPGAYHAFDSRRSSGKTDVSGHPMLYSASATRKARELVKAFLAKHVEVTSKASAGDRLASAGDRFDGAWQGSLRCGDCENCTGPMKKNVKIKIEKGKFNVIPDSTYMGKGAIDDQGNVRIRSTHLTRNFSFDGTYDGNFFRLKGKRGPRTCTIELSRATSPVEAGN